MRLRPILSLVLLAIPIIVSGCLDSDATGAFTPRTEIRFAAGPLGASGRLIHTKDAKVELRGLKYHQDSKVVEIEYASIEDLSTPVMDAQARRMEAMTPIYDREIELHRVFGENANKIILATVLGGGDAVSKILGTGLSPFAGLNIGGPGGFTTGQIQQFERLYQPPAAKPSGACCVDRGTNPPTCVIVSLDVCSALNGTYRGDGTSCHGVDCRATAQ